MVPKADSGAFLLLFLLVLTVTEPLRPGARRGGRGGRGAVGAVCGGGGGAGQGGQCAGPGSPETSLHRAGPLPGRAPARPAPGPPRPPRPPLGTVPHARDCAESLPGLRAPRTSRNFVLEGCYLWIGVCGALRALRLTEARVMCGARRNSWGLGVLWPRSCAPGARPPCPAAGVSLECVGRERAARGGTWFPMFSLSSGLVPASQPWKLLGWKAVAVSLIVTQ